MRVLVAVAAAVGLMLVVAAPASAMFPEHTQGTVPAGGADIVTSSLFASAVHNATMTVEPKNPSDSLLFPALRAVFTRKPSKGARLLSCVFLALASIHYNDGNETFVETDTTLLGLFLHACFQLALSLPSMAPDIASMAASGCHGVAKAVTFTVTKVSGGYQGQVNGFTYKPKGRSPLVMSCKRKGQGLQIKIRPRKHGMTLRKAIGPKLGFSLINPNNQPVGFKATFAVK
jgi:hypothetical protein